MLSRFWCFKEHDKNKTALITSSEQQITFAQLQIDIDNFSELLPEKTAFVFLKVDNSYASVVAYLVCLQLKIPFLPIDNQIEDGLFAKLLEQYQPTIIINEGGVEFYSEYEHSFHPDLAMMLSTSGTTGSPKLVRLSYKNLASNSASIIKYLNIQPDDVAITTLPMSYSYGLSVLNSHLGAGATVVLNNHGVVTRDFWNKINAFHVTTFSGVPFTFQMLKKLKYKRFNTSSIRYLTQAGGKLDEETLKYFVQECSELAQKFIVMYGQTEASPRISYVPANKLISKISSIGVAIPNGRLELLDSNGEAITVPHQEGEIVYEGDNVMMGYAESPADFSLSDTQGQRLHTGDLGYFDEDNYFYITGRAKRFIKLFGLRISLDELDNWLFKNDVQAICSGNDEKLVICYVDKDLDCIATKSKVAQNFKLNVNSIHFKYIKELPRNSNGKIDYKALLAVIDF